MIRVLKERADIPALPWTCHISLDLQSVQLPGWLKGGEMGLGSQALLAPVWSLHCSWSCWRCQPAQCPAQCPVPSNKLGYIHQSPTSMFRLFDLYECLTAIQQKLTKKFAYSGSPKQLPVLRFRIQAQVVWGRKIFASTLSCSQGHPVSFVS